jgi:antibiotic biosynthesis monooxygenase (ABM) superfamily enzyme
VRFALLVFLFVYPLVTVGLLILMPLTPGWPIPARTLVLVPIIVCSMVWGIIPFIQTRLRPWP